MDVVDVGMDVVDVGMDVVDVGMDVVDVGMDGWMLVVEAFRSLHLVFLFF